MTALDRRMVTPALLVTGDTILDQRGRSCVVESRTPAFVSLRIGDKLHEVPVDKLPEQVELVQSAAEAHERAVALAQVRLGGEVVGHKDANGPYRVPAAFPDLASWLSHHYLFHQHPDRDARVPASFPTGNLRDLLAHHDDDHTRVLVVPHVHEPDYYRRAGLDTGTDSA